MLWCHAAVHLEVKIGRFQPFFRNDCHERSEQLSVHHVGFGNEGSSSSTAIFYAMNKTRTHLCPSPKSCLCDENVAWGYFTYLSP